LKKSLPDHSLNNIDVVFHLAGKAHALSETRQDEKEYSQINTEGTRRILEAARDARVRRFVFFSSVKAINEGSADCLNETSVCLPETPYGKSKLEGEHLVLKGKYVPEPVVLRLTMVYGPAMKGNLPRMIDAIAKGRFPPIPEFANQRSMVHVDDVVHAALLAAVKPAAVGQTYIVTDGQTYSTRQLYEWIYETLGKSVPRWRIPKAVFQGLARLGDVIGKIRGRRFFYDSDTLNKLAGSTWYSSQKIKRELGYHAKYQLRDSLRGIL
ncbi:MAG: NAD-dependent epimerase/dehydratase family protein, partial [Nitrospinae bacterium]|nr:NAD-dependent epimerase/dehydratase family protein [Nitrospinota bacterium]